jgi:pyruvate/2-oxoglutarate dehydrogenase complex dihydrolipoamide dehydrogenase (E3) component
MAQFDYDLVVLGAGSGGISAVNLGLNLGKKVALVEKNRIGGECTWSGCVPSKALIKAAEAAFTIKNMEKYGLKTAASKQVDTRKVMDHVRAVIARVYEEEKPEVFQRKGIDVYIASPSFVNPNQVKAGERVISSKRFIISTGSHPFVPPIQGIDTVRYLTNENLFQLKTLPGSMVIIGGGPIGSEMASALNRLGVKITIVEQASHILSREEDELAEMLMKRMVGEGVKVMCDSQAVKVEKTAKGIRIYTETPRLGVRKVEAEQLLVAVGRRPNIEGLNLEKAGVDYTSRGIIVGRTMRTTGKNIYAIGDVVGLFLFSHMAEYWAAIAVPNAVLPLPVKKRANYKNLPWSTFTDPELARAGVTEKEARKSYGDSIRVYRYPYSGVDRAKTDMTEEGMVKIVTTRRGMILGVHILGAHAADLMHELLMVKTLGHPLNRVADMIHAYPTYGDAIKRPAARFYGDKLRDNPVIKIIQKLRK